MYYVINGTHLVTCESLGEVEEYLLALSKKIDSNLEIAKKVNKSEEFDESIMDNDIVIIRGEILKAELKFKLNLETNIEEES